MTDEELLDFYKRRRAELRRDRRHYLNLADDMLTTIMDINQKIARLEEEK